MESHNEQCMTEIIKQSNKNELLEATRESGGQKERMKPGNERKQEMTDRSNKDKKADKIVSEITNERRQSEKGKEKE